MSNYRSQALYLWALLISIISLLSFVVYWASVTELDLITRGNGRVVASGQNKSVEAPDSGQVIAIAVSEGQLVTKGDIIATINPTFAQSSIDELRARQVGYEAVLTRTQAEIDGVSLASLKEELSLFPSDIAVSQLLLFESRMEDFASEVSTFEKQIQQLEKVELEKEKELEGTKDLIKINQIERDEIEPLVKGGVIGNAELYRLEREKTQLNSRLSTISAQIEQNRKLIEKTELDVKKAEKSRLSNLYAERADAAQQLSEIKSQIPKFQQKLSQTNITSPIAGVINQLFINTVGAVVNSGEEIAEIVPTGKDLEIQAFVDPKDIAKVEPGQKARISLTAYDSARYGYMLGAVVKVSTDAVFSEETKSYMYSVNLSFNNDLKNNDGSLVAILPGMIGQVDIVRGRRTILEYIWQPVAKIKDDAFRQ